MSASLNWIAWCSEIALAEGLPLLRVLAGDVVGGLGDPDRLRGDPDPAAVEGLHRDAEALVLLVQQPVPVDERAFDDEVVRRRRVEPELLLVARDADVVGVEDEGADAARARRSESVRAKREERARVAAVRDPLLRAGDPPAVAVGLGARAQRAGVGAGLRAR